MKPDLDQIINALEKEKKSLERQIKDSLSESDYLIAYYHSEALSRLNHQLHNLYLFKDPLYNEKMHLEHLKNSFKKKPENVKDKVSWKRIKERWKERIQNEKLQLMAKKKDLLNKVFYDSQEIDDALFSLHEGKCNGFKLTFDDSHERDLNFVKKDNKLIITIDLYSELDEPDFVVDNRSPNPFKNLGFKYDGVNNNMIYEYDMAGFNNAWSIKLLLSRLFFDVYHIYDIHQPAKLIYY